MSLRRTTSDQSAQNLSTMSEIYEQLCKLGYMNDVSYLQSPSPNPSSINPHDNPDSNPELAFNFTPVDTIVTNFLDFTPELLSFVQCNMRQQITSAASSLHDAHARCLQTLILYAHDLARDVLVTPKRIKYARMKEEELYTQLVELASKKQSEIKELVNQAIADATEPTVQQVNNEGPVTEPFPGLFVSKALEGLVSFPRHGLGTKLDWRRGTGNETACFNHHL